MKLIKWNLHEDVEAYTTTRKLGDISLNNPNYLKVLENLLFFNLLLIYVQYPYQLLALS